MYEYSVENISVEGIKQSKYLKSVKDKQQKRNKQSAEENIKDKKQSEKKVSVANPINNIKIITMTEKSTC